MDIRLHSNPQHHYAVNGGANSRPGEDDLQFLSQEEQECIQFFENTIVSLEESLKEEDRRPGQVKPTASSHGPVERVDGPPNLSHNHGLPVSSLLARPPNPKDQDIIDLVRPEPDLVQTKQSIFSHTNLDFQRMVPTPESHFEIKPKRDVVDGLPLEYNSSLPSSSFGQIDSHSSYHPPGCIPTPVLIAQKIAENQAGGTSNLLPSSLQRRQSLESERPPSYSSDPHVKQGPPTSAKPTRFPANISVIHGSKEHQNQSVANVNIQERRAKMLANLTGMSHPLLQEDPQQAADQRARNAPTRSISFTDPTPDVSRMEALSKLGLARNRAMSGDMSLLPNSTTVDPLPGVQTSAKPLETSVPPTAESSTKLPQTNVTRPPHSHIHVEKNWATSGGMSLLPNNTTIDPLPGVQASAKPLEASVLPVTETNTKFPQANVTRPPQSQIPVDRKPEILRTDSLKSHEDRNPQPILPPPAVTSLELNSYGGKSIIVHPSVSSKSETATSPTSPEPKIVPPALSNPSEFNAYGGKSKVMTPASGATTRNDLPDILSSHIDKSQTLSAKSEPLPTELNSYRGKSRTINPSPGLNRPSEGPTRSFKAPAPTPAPKPNRHTIHVAAQKAAPRALSPEHKRRSGSIFRPQGITVQFSGRGPMNESRREALRKLGLLKDS